MEESGQIYFGIDPANKDIERLRRAKAELEELEDAKLEDAKGASRQEQEAMRLHLDVREQAQAEVDAHLNRAALAAETSIIHILERKVAFLEAAVRQYADHAWNDVKRELDKL